MKNTSATPPDQDLVVADIGGTNARFAIATRQAGHSTIDCVRSYPCSSATGLAELLRRFLSECGRRAPAHACLAIAGPTNGRSGRLTNLGWDIDAAVMEQQFGLERVLFANDFAALAAAAPGLAADATVLLKPGTPRAGGPISVLGPGTGLGVALVVPHAGGWATVGTEGGHVSFAPCSTLELELCAWLRERHEHVSVETVLSGPGLQRVHAFLGGAVDLSAAEIGAAALDGSDARCLRAAQLFLSILGSVAGDIALAHGATGGVFIGGGIVPRLAPLLESSTLCANFIAKGPMRALLERIPLRLITAEHVALAGAAALYRESPG